MRCCYCQNRVERGEEGLECVGCKHIFNGCEVDDLLLDDCTPRYDIYGNEREEGDEINEWEE